MLQVFLTVDVETYTGNYNRDIRGYGKGLDYVVAQMKRSGLRATFFLEALGATQWGAEPLKEIVRLLVDADQDIQLHLHPVVAEIDGFQPDDDAMWALDADAQAQLICRGLEILRECGAKDITAFRAGDLAADDATLKAMAMCGIRLGSNRDLDTKRSIRTRLNDAFPVRNDLSERNGVLDLPVTALRSALPFLDGQYRHLQITAMGSREMRDGLIRMSRAGYVTATILTHPQEFFRFKGDIAVPIRKNCRRLEALLDFLRDRQDMHVLTLSECAKNCETPTGSPPEICAAPAYSLMRVAEQGIDRLRGGRMGR